MVITPVPVLVRTCRKRIKKEDIIKKYKNNLKMSGHYWTAVHGGRRGNATTHRPRTHTPGWAGPPVLDRAFPAPYGGRPFTQSFTQPVPAGVPSHAPQRSYAQALMNISPRYPEQRDFNPGFYQNSPQPPRSQPRRRRPRLRSGQLDPPRPTQVIHPRDDYRPAEQSHHWDRAPPDLARVSRQFYKVMKVIHHSSNISPFQNPPKTIANLTHLLSSTIKPAYPSPGISDLVWGSAKNWEFSIMLALRQHYDDTLVDCLNALSHQDLWVWEDAFRLAETWIRKRFKRVREDTFHTARAKIEHFFVPVQIASPQQRPPVVAAGVAPLPPRASSETRPSTSRPAVSSQGPSHSSGASSPPSGPPPQPAPPSPLLLLSDPVTSREVDDAQRHPPEIPVSPVPGPSHSHALLETRYKPITTPQRHDPSITMSLSPSQGRAPSHPPVVPLSPVPVPTRPRPPSDTLNTPLTTPQRHNSSITMSLPGQTTSHPPGALLSPASGLTHPNPPLETVYKTVTTPQGHDISINGSLPPLQGRGRVDDGTDCVTAPPPSLPPSPLSGGNAGALSPQSSPPSETLTDLIQLIEADPLLTSPAVPQSNPSADTQLELSREDLEELLGNEPPPVFKPTLHPHTVNKMLDWRLTISKPILMVGDSNLSRFPYYFHKNIQVDSFPGASFVHGQALLDRAVINCKNIEKIIISLGINCRSQRSAVTTQQIDTLIRSAKRRFPKTEIWIPLVNFSENLPAHERDALEKMNTHLSQTSAQILPLAEDFSTAPDQVHWNTRTAKNIWSHWLSYLNL